MLSCDSELAQASAGLRHALIYFGTLAEFCEESLSGASIRIGFPASAAQAVFASVFDKADHIAQRITEEKADFMREIGISLKTLAERF